MVNKKLNEIYYMTIEQFKEKYINELQSGAFFFRD